MNNKTRKVLLLLASLAASVALVCGCAGGADSGGSGGVTDSVSSETGGGSEQQEATILVTELSHVYDGTAKQVGVKVAPAAAGTPTIKYFSGEEEVTSCVKAGTYTVEVSLETEGYRAETVKKTMTIAPKAVSLSGITAVDKYYDGTAEIAYTGVAALEGIVGDDEVSLENLSLTAESAAYGIGKNAGIAAVLGGKDAGNYTLEAGSRKVNIYPVVNGFKYLPVVRDGEVTEYKLTGYTGSETSVVIPASLDDIPVTALDESCFRGNTAIENVSFPAGLPFSAAAFYGCNSLLSVTTADTGFAFKPTFEDNAISEFAITGYGGKGGEVTLPSALDGVPVTVAGNYVFAGNGTVTALTIPSSISRIGLAFAQNATALKTVVFEDRTKEITWETDDFGAWTFAGSSVESITVGKGIKTIPNIFATGAAALREVIFGEDTTSVNAEAFRNCVSLTTVTGYERLTSVAANAFQMDVDNFILFPTVESGAIVSYTAAGFLETAAVANVPSKVGNIPVTALADRIFAGHAAVTSISIPASVEKIGLAMAQNTTALKTVVFADRTKDIVWGRDDYGCWTFADSTVESITVGSGLKTIPDIFAVRAKSLKTVTLGESVETIGAEAFKECTSLKTIELPDSLKAIYSFAFFGCTALEEITIPAAVANMGQAVFQGASALRTAVFEDRGHDVTFGTDGDGRSWMFFLCGYLETLTIGDGITSLPAVFAPTAATTVKLGKDVVNLAAESLPASGTVLTLYIDSGAIAQGLLSADSYFGVFKNAATICVKEGLEASNYIKGNYPHTSSADGYTIYSKTERV